ncbi:MAG: 3-keto-5-aminohexanoate cleavage protein [Pseudomonadota bacterium]
MSAPVILMAAPNGARRSKADHPALPIAIPETVAEAKACRAAGAAMLHAHVRDAAGVHTLDAGLYRELIAEMATAVPDMIVQITTEAVGRYSPAEQIACVKAVQPEAVSVGLREIAPSAAEEDEARRFFAWAAESGVQVQHILFSPEDVARFERLAEGGLFGAGTPCVLHVLGRYSETQQSDPEELTPMLAAMRRPATWFICAFGSQEADCARAAIEQGGHARVGFENNLHLPDGRVADGTSDLIATAARSAAELGRPVASPAEARRILGID